MHGRCRGKDWHAAGSGMQYIQTAHVEAHDAGRARRGRAFFGRQPHDCRRSAAMKIRPELLTVRRGSQLLDVSEIDDEQE